MTWRSFTGRRKGKKGRVGGNRVWPRDDFIRSSSKIIELDRKMYLERDGRISAQVIFPWN
jgi:hypothetical protein